MIGQTDEVNVDLLMAVLSIFITGSVPGIGEDRRDRLHAALADGRSMRLGIDVGPRGLAIVGHVDDDEGNAIVFLELEDNTDKWISWALALVGRPEVSPDA